jgi:hypothetical protein
MAYVYRHIRLDKNEPFYIGIGNDQEYKRAHDKYACRRSKFWKKIADKTEYIVEILFDDIDFEFAKQKEIEFIKLYGRKNLGTGPLCNLTDGGDGLANIVFTEQHRQRLSAANKGTVLSVERRKQMSEHRKNNPIVYTEELRRKLSESHKGIKPAAHLVQLLKERTGEKNPMYGRRNYNFMGEVSAYKDGVQVGVYDGIHKAAAALNVTATKISACLNGRRKTTGGYTFKRLNPPNGVALITLDEQGNVDVQNKRIKNGRIM